LLLPATDVILLELNLPVSSPRQLKQALPYAIEDYLASDVEDYHWVWSKQAGDKVAVVALEHSQMAAYCGQFSEAGIKLQGVYPETVWLPLEEDRVSVLLDNHRAIVRFSAWHGGGMDADFLNTFVEKTINEHDLPKQIQFWHTQAEANIAWSPELNVNSETLASALSLLRPDKKNELNLLTDSYSPQEANQQNWKVWLPAAAMILLAVIIQYGDAIMAYRHSQSQLAELEAANQALFQQTFPNIKRIVNIKAQAEQELLALQKQGGGNSSLYLRLLYQSGENLAKDQALQVQALEFTNGILSLHLTGSSIAQIETFKQSMEKTPGIRVNIQSAETGDQGLSAHLDISEQSS
jgi:general secretion pathway protein L